MQLLAGPDHVVPLAMESVRLDPQRTKLSLRHLLAGRIAATIEPRAHDEAAAVAGVADEVDDRLVGPQGTTAPVDRDEREEAVLDLVPLARARREVADTDRHAELVGDSLELVLPHVRPVAVAAARVGGDEELSRFGVALRADLGPPRLDRGDGKDRRVVVDADADEAVVGGEVIHAVRNRLADRVGREVVDVDQFGLALRIPLAPRVLEVADQFLLLGVDGDDRHTALDAVLGLGVDVLELRVAIRVLGAFDGLVRRLQAVAVVAKEPGDRPVADLDVVLREQFLGQHHRALARPAQRRLGVAACDRVDELLERGPHLGVQDFERSLAGTTPNLDDVLGPRARASSRPLRTVLIAIPVARATMATPPYPIAPASVPAQSRRARSSMVAFSRRHFSRTVFSGFTAEVDHAGQILSIPLRSISTPTRSTRPFGSPYGPPGFAPGLAGLDTRAPRATPPWPRRPSTTSSSCCRGRHGSWRSSRVREHGGSAQHRPSCC